MGKKLQKAVELKFKIPQQKKDNMKEIRKI